MSEDQDMSKKGGGYYTVNIMIGEARYPFIIFAHSDYEAAHLVRQETGYLAGEGDVEGPSSGIDRGLPGNLHPDHSFAGAIPFSIEGGRAG